MIYALKQDGTLLWYQHDGYKDGTLWQGPVQIDAALIISHSFSHVCGELILRL